MFIRSLIASTVALTAVAPAFAAPALSDVQPTDWAYGAIQNLNARYGCLVGYPNGTLKPAADATRSEVFALTNHCLDNITQFYTQADAQLAASLRAQIGATNKRVTKLEVAAVTATQRRQLGVGNYGGIAFSGNAANYPGVTPLASRVYESGVTLQGRLRAVELGNQYAVSARPYVTFTSTPNYVSGGVFGGGLATLDIPLSRRTLADGTKVSAANLYVGAGGQVGGNQSAGVGVVGAEVSVAKNIVLFADAKIPFAETGAETFGSVRAGRATYNYGSGQGYNVTSSVGLGFKF
jgi:S-layer homology domain